MGVSDITSIYIIVYNFDYIVRYTDYVLSYT